MNRWSYLWRQIYDAYRVFYWPPRAAIYATCDWLTVRSY
jgi:hypothetical protein